MKVKRFSFLLFFVALCCLIVLPLSQNSSSQALAQNVTTLSEGDPRLSKDYWEKYRITSEFFSVTGDRGGENTLQYAFDGNWNTFYQASTDTNLGSLTFTFNREVTLSSIIFAISQSASNSKPDGYPAKLIVQADENETIEFESTPSISKMLFSFDELSCTTLKLTFEMKGSYNWRQTASEIVFLQPKIAEIDSIFANYSQTELNEEFNNEDAITALENKLKGNINYEKGFKPIIDRARKILSKEVSFVQAREFSTDENANNRIKQNGDIASYCRTTLKMRYMGTNRQVTGIYGKSGEEISVYVEGDGKDLPKIQFSQFNGFVMDEIGHNTWLGGEQTLNIGKNTFTFPTFDLQGSGIMPGGPIYIVNPFAEEQGTVKVYIEGGHEFPVFRKNGNESAYLDSLAAFVAEEDMDITEMEGDNIIITIGASMANKNYSENKAISPQQNLEKWDNFIKELLTFDGINLSQGQYYDEKNQFINVNIRLMQPDNGAASYAAYEHVGVFSLDGNDGWLKNAIQFTEAGWGFAHEIGHMLDLPERTVSECSNNMFSMYTVTCIAHTLRTPSFYQNTLNHMLNPTTQTFFDDGKRSNYLIWWYIENYCPGYWGKLDNLYRFGESVTGLSATEKQVYLSSLATGIDLSYYFEKWGYSLNGTDEIFKTASASDAFKNLINQKIKQGVISNKKQPKIWYAKDGNDPTLNHQIYSSNQKLEVSYVEKTQDGYKISMPLPTSPAHLGYEIYLKTESGYTFLTFTYDNTYEDLNSYENEPEYEIVAIDSSFSTSALPGQDENKAQPQQTNVGLIVGVVVGAVAAIAVIVIVIILLKRKNK